MIRTLLAGLGAIALVGACSPGAIAPPSAPAPRKTPATAPERVVALVGSVGAMSLVARGSASGDDLAPRSASGLPRDAAWLSSDGTTLLVTTLDGTALHGPGSGAGAWIRPPGDLAGSHPTRAFGSLEPLPAIGGAAMQVQRIAFVEGDPGSGNPGSLVVGALSGTDVRRYALPRAVEAAPAWLPDGRIAFVARDDRDQPRARILDPATGTSGSAGDPPLRSVAVGGGLIATIGVDGIVRAGPITSWLDRLPLSAVGLGGPTETVLQAQPSPSGTELAIVVADEDGDAASIRILAAAGGWREIARFGLPSGANRAVVS